ncbi:MAG TPA: hypothetical protein VHM30_19055 [Gemmatimonadaceae bacterium]|nr:hypothetical protein [Gemmatimonadaceae bacterium]
MTLITHACASVVACALVAAPLLAQDASSTASGWRFQPTVSVGEQLDDNVFLLPDAKKTRLGAGAPAGSRYAAMASASDVVTTVSAQATLRGAGLAGRTLSIVPEFEYDLYVRNPERRGGRLGVSLAQKMARGGLLRLKGSMQPQTFFKNYLLDAIDGNNDGSIDASERLYAPAKQGESSAEADYTFRLRKATTSHPLGAALRVGAGWYSRTNNSSFASRDLHGPTASARLLMTPGSSSRIDLAYDYALLGAPAMRNVAILDESQFQRDFNGNGTTNDAAARAFEMVDRSRSEQELSATAGNDFGRTDLEVSYAHRARTFSSSQPYDVGNNGRRDARNEFGGTLRFRLGDALRLRASLQRGTQTLNRASANVSTGDVADYSRTRSALVLEYRF